MKYWDYWIDMAKLALWLSLLLALAFCSCFAVLWLLGGLVTHVAPGALVVIKVCVWVLSVVMAPFALVGAFLFANRK